MYKKSLNYKNIFILYILIINLFIGQNNFKNYVLEYNSFNYSADSILYDIICIYVIHKYILYMIIPNPEISHYYFSKVK